MYPRMLRTRGDHQIVVAALEARDVDALYRVHPSGREFIVTMKNEALETMRQGIAEAEAEPEPDPELVFDNAYVLPPPNMREGWDA